MGNEGDILRKITEFYLSSCQFNGFPIRDILKGSKFGEIELKNILISLIREKKISLNFGDIHPEDEKQIEKISNVRFTLQ